MTVKIKLDRDELLRAAESEHLWAVFGGSLTPGIYYGQGGDLRELSGSTTRLLDKMIGNGTLRLVHDMAGVYRIAGS